MIFHGTRYGVNLFNGRVQWFTDRGEAEALEKIEVAKFVARDSERERIRLARLGLKEVARTYSVSLPEPTTSPCSRRGRNPR